MSWFQNKYLGIIKKKFRKIIIYLKQIAQDDSRICKPERSIEKGFKEKLKESKGAQDSIKKSIGSTETKDINKREVPYTEESILSIKREVSKLAIDIDAFAIGDANYKHTDGKWYKDPTFKIRSTDDTHGIQEAIDLALKQNIGKIDFKCKRYLVNGTLNCPSGICLNGLHLNMGTTGVTSTEIVHDQNNVILRSEGTSILKGKPNSALRINNITFHGNDLSANLIELIACTDVQFNNVFLKANIGTGLYMKEVMDSRFNNLYSDWCGTTDGTRAVIEIESGNGYEFSNQLHFNGGRIESYRGTALRTIGKNTNELFFQSMKFESLFSNKTHLEFNNVVALHLNGVNVCSKGLSENIISQQIIFNNCVAISGDLYLEHQNGARIDKFVKILNGSNDIDLCNHIYGNGENILSPAPIMVDGSSYNLYISGHIVGSRKPICNVDNTVTRQKVIGSSSTPSGTVYYPYDYTNEYFEIGRITADKINHKFMFIHKASGEDEQVVFEVNGKSELSFNKSMFILNNAFHPANLTNVPWGKEGSFYVDKSVTPNAMRTYSNGMWRRISYANNVKDCKGRWQQGDLIYNTNPKKGEYIGWVRLTNGDNHVAGIDWQIYGKIPE
ncbi:hypothetical protein GFV16_01070 [Bacillus megaterium]|uniref:hypothetical protein n=1 Tax=Priestia megaterium TaxID=1404 RepID=UPI0012933907|nr:hypothetical protein [Priestia megaterium]MQR84533.1 hypothetical protein [Priestia megaterium]